MATAFLTRAISGLEARQVEISSHSIALVLPAPIADPGPLGARLRTLAELARALSDSGGPYR